MARNALKKRGKRMVFKSETCILPPICRTESVV
jgi:hypothetical protein